MIYSSSKPAFCLIDHNGHSVTDADFRGKYAIVFFGFTKCKVVCPRALERLNEVFNNLKSAADRFNALYISVDPDRDTPETIKSFLAHRGGRFIGLTGTKEQVDLAKKAFRIFSNKREEPSEPDGYVISHTAMTYVLGPDGELVDHFNDTLGAQEVTLRLQNILNRDSVFMTEKPVPESVPNDTNVETNESLSLLSKEQVASIRHIGNLARQLKGDWSNMMAGSDLSDGFGAYRFQLAYGAYALALAHFHRLPAAPGLFKGTMERMIQKMCHPDCWYYWRDASTGGGIANTLRKESVTNPVHEDNIMYSAYLQTMTLLYNSLFNDDRYKTPGSLSLQYDPFFWGEGAFNFQYDQDSINNRVYWQMVESGYLGVACEPGCVFQICNQPPIIGFRLHDELNGGETAQEVTTGFLKAWEEFGGNLDNEGGYTLFVSKHNKVKFPSAGTGMDAWCATLMHSWNPQLVEENYERQRKRSLIHYDDGTISIKITMHRGTSENIIKLLKGGELGWMAALASEVGDTETLNGLLAYAKKKLSPRYQNGGLFYPRRDEVYDENGDYVMGTPIQSNALLPLARLNVPSGFRRLYQKPWGPKNSKHYDEPALTEVDFDIDVYRAVYLPEKRTLLFDVAAFEHERQGWVGLARVFGRGEWTLERSGSMIAWGSDKGLAGSGQGEEIKQDGEMLYLHISRTAVLSHVVKWV
ncbi:hypothetical protein NW762_014008 [Fusarium torreyae]|uniref:Thioredoxin domain-containing protein n=1 Tax=Fusarium torreyae TaxID=1237075 RepID=A0A9W8RMG6_9HYPO|nr:hypothetical protein NW762_014008 [Fusarium torreyae]